jgi:quinol monooxygenase YgiN
MIFVVATIEVAAGKRDAFLAEFRQIVPKVHAEEGCLEYLPMLDLETRIPAQPDPRPNVVTVVEKWASVAALESHLIAPHMLEYREKVKELVTQVTIHVLEPA